MSSVYERPGIRAVSFGTDSVANEKPTRGLRLAGAWVLDHRHLELKTRVRQKLEAGKEAAALTQVR